MSKMTERKPSKAPSYMYVLTMIFLIFLIDVLFSTLWICEINLSQRHKDAKIWPYPKPSTSQYGHIAVLFPWDSVVPTFFPLLWNGESWLGANRRYGAFYFLQALTTLNAYITSNSIACFIDLLHPALQKSRFPRLARSMSYELNPDLDSRQERITNFPANITINTIGAINALTILRSFYSFLTAFTGLARHGRSKDGRKDAKSFVFALVINPFGFIKHSSVYQGNIGECTTLEAIIKDLRTKTSTTAKKALVVIDAGIAKFWWSRINVRQKIRLFTPQL